MPCAQLEGFDPHDLHQDDEDDGAGVGDLDDWANWREPPLDELFAQGRHIPGDTPPSGLEEPACHYLSSWDDHADDREDEDESDEPADAMMASPSALQVVDMSPTEPILDLGGTEAMGSSTAVIRIRKNIDSQGYNTYLWYEIKPNASQFSFANSQASKCTEKLVVYMSDNYSSVHCAEFDIVPAGSLSEALILGVESCVLW